MQIEALILRRCYPVPVTFADLRRASQVCEKFAGSFTTRTRWHAALKKATGAVDEVYAVVDGQETLVARVYGGERGWAFEASIGYELVDDICRKADRSGYWQHPHEVRVDFETTRPTHDEVARAVLVGQQVVETGGVVRS